WSNEVFQSNPRSPPIKKGPVSPFLIGGEGGTLSAHSHATLNYLFYIDILQRLKSCLYQLSASFSSTYRLWSIVFNLFTHNKHVNHYLLNSICDK
ncbi:MAG: hypothetical protein AB2793_00135, partial [Candidatus Thiodiazotropha sp.]